MINLHERMLPTLAGLNPRPPGLQSDGEAEPGNAATTCYLGPMSAMW